MTVAADSGNSFIGVEDAVANHRGTTVNIHTTAFILAGATLICTSHCNCKAVDNSIRIVAVTVNNVVGVVCIMHTIFINITAENGYVCFPITTAPRCFRTIKPAVNFYPTYK